jgi:hypothetical protein
MASNNYIYKMSNAGGMATVTRYTDMLAGNTVWNPWSPDGAYDSLATVTVPSGGLASVTFAGIPNTYKHLQIRGIARNTSSGGNLDYALRFNGDSSTSNYAWHRLFGDGATTYGQWNVNPVGQAFIGITTQSTDTASAFASSVTDILDYAATNKNKTVRSLWGKDTNGTGLVGLASALWINSSTAITSILVLPQSGNFAEYSQFTLYGVR